MSLDERNGDGRLLAPWADWPAATAVLWLCVRPLLALAAAVCVFADGTAPLWLEAITAIAVLSVRSVRTPWLPAIIAIGVAAVSLPAGILLGIRVLLGEGALFYLGRARRGGARRLAGLDAVAVARLDVARRLTGAPFCDLERARTEFKAALHGRDEDAVLERAAAYSLAAWAHWRRLELLGLARRVVRGVLRGQWSGPKESSFERELLRLAVFEELLTGVVRWLSLAVAAGVAFVASSGVDAPLLGGGVGGRCAAALATLLIAMPLTRRSIGIVSAALAAAFAWWLTSGEVWEPIAIAIATAFAVSSLRPMVEAINVAGRSRWRRWPPPSGTPRRLRPNWRVASRAIAAGNDRIAVEILEHLARGEKAPAELFTAALGLAALLEVDLGRLQAAAGHLEEISERNEDPSGTAAAATGMLALALGDLDRAEEVLRPALEELDGSSPLVPRATLALCDVLVRRGDVDAALKLTERLREQPFAIRGLAGALEAQLAVAEALVRRGDEEQALSFLEELDNLLDDSDLPLGKGLDGRRRMQRAAAQALILRGQLMLGEDASQAVAYLERAVGMAATAGDEALVAAAEVLLGAAFTRSGKAEAGLGAIARGVAGLEERRVQLRASKRRSALIVASESLYAWALRGLRAAQLAGEKDAGAVGVELIESLRKSALAETLRSGPLPIDPVTQNLIERIRIGEDDGTDDVERLRTTLREQISARFADAYLPRRPTADRLGDMVRQSRHHVLSFHVPPSGFPGWRAWIQPDGEMRIDQVDAPEATEQGLLAALATDGVLPAERLHEPLFESVPEWERLGVQLLPEELRELLQAAPIDRPESLLVVPDGPLALVPWAALHIDGRPLVEMAVVKTAPALEPAGVAIAPTPAERVVAHLPNGSGDGELGPLRAGNGLQIVHDREKFLSALRSELFDGAYMASHGSRLGLRQKVEFADGSTLSAATALGCAWPTWVVFSSCLVGRVEQVPGHEPFGLPISCMLRGADTVAASVVELTDEGAKACGKLAAGLAQGRDPAHRLRDAQLEQLRGRALTSLADGLGLICISSALGRRTAERLQTSKI